jgi:PAS domain S-box-containing protein
MSDPATEGRQWNERSSATGAPGGDTESMFRLLFERSADAIWLFDPREQVFVDCNEAAVQLMRSGSRDRLLRAAPAELSPPCQPDGRNSLEAAREVSDIVERQGAFRFEWLARRCDGTDVPLEVISTVIQSGGRSVHVVVSRDISERRQAEEKFRLLNVSLERRVAERTAELTESEARLRTLIEHAPEAIVVFDGESSRFVSCNENATRLFGLSREALAQMGPAEVSPLVQADGRLSVDAAREHIAAAMAGRPVVFEWMHRRADGGLIPCEVRLVRLPGDGRPLIRGSIIDNSERRRREQMQRAVFDILEAVHEAGDLGSLFQRIHTNIQRLMSARNFYIALYDPAAGMISFPYYVEESGHQVVEPRPLGTGLTGYVLRTGRPLLVDSAMNARKKKVGDAVTFEGYAEITYVEAGRPAAIWLGVPLLLEDRPVGVMAVQDYEDETAYGAGEKEILTYVARQTALAIDRKRSEQALRESEQKFRALFEASSQGVILHDEKEYLEVNPATLRILGYERASDLIGLNPVSTAPPVQPGGSSTARLARRHIRECMQNGTARFDWVARRADGRDVPLEVILTRIEMGGRLIIQAVINDISDRKKAEAELRASEARLRESEARFSAAFHASPVYLSIARLNDGRFVEANDAFVQWLGLSREAILGHTSVELDLWAKAEERSAYWRELWSTGRVRDRECLLQNKRGARHLALLSGDIIEINKEPHVLNVGLDITDRKRAEAELLRALGREKELSQLKSDFVSMVSHEFRTPLGIIMSSAEILGDYLDQLEPDERGHHLRSIARHSKRMSEMMEEVLVLGRLDAGRMDFKPGPLEVAPFFERLVEEVRSATEQRCPIRLAIAGLPAGQADERLLRHVFLNLLTNAVKYGEPGQPVDLTVEAEGTDALCRVIDRGIGIPDTDLPWLFNAFHRGRNVGQRPGTGLGLVIVKRCVELHHGRIQVESQMGQGTVVTVRLPLFPND